MDRANSTENRKTGTHGSTRSICWSPRRSAPTPSWKTSTSSAVRGAHRQQVEHDGLQGQHDRAEDQQQQQEAEPQHEGDDDGQPAVDDAGVVDVERGRSGDVDGDVEVVEGSRHVVLAQAHDGGAGLGPGGVTGERDLHQGEVAVRGGRHGRRTEGAVTGDEVPQPLRRRADLGDGGTGRRRPPRPGCCAHRTGSRSRGRRTPAGRSGRPAAMLRPAVPVSSVSTGSASGGAVRWSGRRSGGSAGED